MIVFLVNNKSKGLSENEQKALIYIENKYGYKASVNKSSKVSFSTGPFGHASDDEIIKMNYNDKEFIVYIDVDDKSTSEGYKCYDNYQYDEINEKIKEQVANILGEIPSNVFIRFNEPYLDKNIYDYTGLIANYYNGGSVIEFMELGTEFEVHYIDKNIDENNLEKLKKIMNKPETFIYLNFKDENSYNKYIDNHKTAIFYCGISNVAMYYEELILSFKDYLKNYYISKYNSPAISNNLE